MGTDNSSCLQVVKQEALSFLQLEPLWSLGGVRTCVRVRVCSCSCPRFESRIACRWANVMTASLLLTSRDPGRPPPNRRALPESWRRRWAQCECLASASSIGLEHRVGRVRGRVSVACRRFGYQIAAEVSPWFRIRLSAIPASPWLSTMTKSQKWSRSLSRVSRSSLWCDVSILPGRGLADLCHIGDQCQTQSQSITTPQPALTFVSPPGRVSLPRQLRWSSNARTDTRAGLHPHLRGPEPSLVGK